MITLRKVDKAITKFCEKKAIEEAKKEAYLKTWNEVFTPSYPQYIKEEETVFWVPKPAITKVLKKTFKPSITDVLPLWSYSNSTGSTKSTKAKEYVSTITPFRGMRYIKRILDSIRNKKAYICGGYARYVLSANKNPAKAKDIDIFFIDSTTLAEVQAELEHKGWMEGKTVRVCYYTTACLFPLSYPAY